MTTQSIGTIANASTSLPLTLDPNDASVSILCSGTHAGITLNFEVSFDGTVWLPVLASRSDSAVSAVSSVALVTNSISVWNVPVAQFRMMRVRSSAYTSGTLNVRMISDDQPVVFPAVSVTSSAAPSTPVYTSHVFKSTAAQPLVSVKTSAGMMHNLLVTNTTATPTFLKLYDKASAPVPATDVPFAIINVTANTFLSVNFGAAGKRFSTGIAYSFGSTVADIDTAALTAGQIYMTFDYE